VVPSDWLQAHESQLPQMTDGERINGDPIIYAANSPEYTRKPTIAPKLCCSAPGCAESKKTGVDMLEEALMRSAGLTGKELAVLWLRAKGATQEQTATATGMSQATVCRIISQVARKLS
jgi:DNA-binding CsgD family transcriptional regulator